MYGFFHEGLQNSVGTGKTSEDMANLNFDAKYTSGGKNEIGVLGENFNKMSDQLGKDNI